MVVGGVLRPQRPARRVQIVHGAVRELEVTHPGQGKPHRSPGVRHRESGSRAG